MTRFVIRAYEKCDRFDIPLKEVMDTFKVVIRDSKPVRMKNVIDAVDAACGVHALYWERREGRLTGFSAFATAVREDKKPTLPRRTCDEYFVAEVIANVDITALADYREVFLEGCDDAELAELLGYQRKNAHKFAVVGYPRAGVETFDNMMYPQCDQQSRIIKVMD